MPWSMAAYKAAHAEPAPAPKPTGAPRSPVADFEPVSPEARAALKPRRTFADGGRASANRRLYEEMSKKAGGFGEEAPVGTMRKTNLRGPAEFVAGNLAINAAKAAKGSLSDKSGGEGSVQANARAAASKAEAFKPPMSKVDRAGQVVKSALKNMLTISE